MEGICSQKKRSKERAMKGRRADPSHCYRNFGPLILLHPTDYKKEKGKGEKNPRSAGNRRAREKGEEKRERGGSAMALNCSRYSAVTIRFFPGETWGGRKKGKAKKTHIGNNKKSRKGGGGPGEKSNPSQCRQTSTLTRQGDPVPYITAKRKGEIAP